MANARMSILANKLNTRASGKSLFLLVPVSLASITCAAQEI
jgi:hypothetical protein